MGSQVDRACVGNPAGAGGSLFEFDELTISAQLIPSVRLYAVLPDLAGADMDEAPLVVAMT